MDKPELDKKVMDHDEFKLLLVENAHVEKFDPKLSRILRSGRIDGGWKVAERFDARFDTEVGQRLKVATQFRDADGHIHSNLDLRKMGDLPTEIAPSVIVDYDHAGKHITESEAEGQLELSGVLARLHERNAEYAQFLAGRDSNDLSKM
ncbi:hypothetical protein AAE485_14245 (plasmid) [Acidithiobacillus ferriphilus]|uniref:hypothetical protein n=1 Tax=Acidithiobacillus ferriphilus TaxID=1689834 RepID=UPI00390CBDFE